MKKLWLVSNEQREEMSVTSNIRPPKIVVAMFIARPNIRMRLRYPGESRHRSVRTFRLNTVLSNPPLALF
jgi:hypothetical protein